MAGEKRQITRNRVSYSCQKCRQRKVKCDKIHPICSVCRNTGDECVYASYDDGCPHGKAEQAGEYQLRKRKHASADRPNEYSRSEPSNGAYPLSDQLGRLEKVLGRLSSIAGLATPSPDESTLYVNEHTDVGLSVPGSQVSRQRSTLSQHQSERTPTIANGLREKNYHYREPNLDVISMQLEQLTGLLQMRNQNATRGDSISNAILSAHTSKQHPKTSDDTSLHIPSEQQRNALFRSWLSSVYPILPIVDPHTVLMHYRTFHFWYLYGLEKGVPNPVEDHVPLIYAVYYAGAVSLSLRGIRKWFPGLNRQDVLSSLRKQFLETLKISRRQLSNPVTIAARVMMSYLSDVGKKDDEIDTNIASLIRAAHSRNLHRERPNTLLNDALAEVSRRLWWEVVNLDTLESTANNVPPLINQMHCDSSLPGELKDVKLGTPEADRYELALKQGRTPDIADEPTTNERESMVSVIYLVQKARTALASTSRELLNVSLAARPKTTEDMVRIRKLLAEIARQITSCIDRIPTKGFPEMDFTPESKPGHSVSMDYGTLYGEDLISSEVEAVSGASVEFERRELPFVLQYRYALIAFHKWSRIALSMLIDQAYCFSYAPFLSRPEKKLWLSSRQCALRHAHSCLRKFNILAMDIELERFRWTWPTMYQPIHACMIVLLDAYESPTSTEAPRSRALFDQMLLLSSPAYGIVEGSDGITSTRPLQESGEEAFTMLMQLRAKAWHKAGLDSTLLWTEQDQIDVGAARPLTEAEKMAQSIREDTALDTSSTNAHTHHLLHSFTQERVKEHLHPSVLGPPDENDTEAGSTSSIRCKVNIATTDTHVPNSKGLKRARSDQPLAPPIPSTQTKLKRGQNYTYKPPSEVSDVGQLIRKIKEYQQAQSSTPHQNSEPTANPDSNSHSTIPVHNGTAGISGTSAAVEAAQADVETEATQAGRLRDSAITLEQQLAGLHTSVTRIQQQRHPMASNIATRVDETSPDSQPRPVSGTDAMPDRDPEPSVLEPGSEPQIDLVNMDFDWAKWDEVFGHILDGDFGNVDVELMKSLDENTDSAD